MVAEGVRKAMVLKNTQFTKSHRLQPDDSSYNEKRKLLAKLESQILRYKHRIRNYSNQIDLIHDKEKLIDLK